MADLELLDTNAHAHLRVGEWDDPTRHFVQIVIAEVLSVAAEYPILLAKNNDTGEFYAGAMFGIKPGENLFLDANGRLRGYRPLDLERQGFYVSDENIAIDPAHPRLAGSNGAPLFEDGEPSALLVRIQRSLAHLKYGIEETDQFLQAMLAAKAVEPIDLSFNFDDGERVVLEGLYTISIEALNDLDDAPVLDLFRKGYLQLAYAISGSRRQIPLLARRRNARLIQ